MCIITEVQKDIPETEEINTKEEVKGIMERKILVKEGIWNIITVYSKAIKTH